MSLQTRETSTEKTDLKDLIKEAGKIIEASDAWMATISQGIDKDKIGSEKSFLDWFKKNFICIPFYLTTIVSLAIIYFVHIKSHEFSKAEMTSIRKNAYLAEIFIILLILLNVAIKGFSTQRFPRTFRILNRGSKATQTFLNYWSYLWVSWFFLYAVLCMNAFDPTILSEPMFQSVIDGCNNLSGVIFFSMYVELAKETQGENNSVQTQPWLLGIIFVFVFFCIEAFVLRQDYIAHGRTSLNASLTFSFSLGYGLIIGVLTGLFVGRLESLLLNIPTFFIIYLTLFAVVQPTFAFLNTKETPYFELSMTLFIIALYGKIFLLTVIHWVKDTDRLFYYMVRRHRMLVQETKNNFREVFLSVVNEIIKESDTDGDDEQKNDQNEETRLRAI